MESKVISPNKFLYLTETADENANQTKSTVKTNVHKKKRLRNRSKSVSLLTTSRSYRRNYFLNNHFERRGSKDQYGVVNVCLKLTSLNVIAPDLRRAGSFNERIVSPHRSSHQRSSVKKGVLRYFTKFTGKHLCQSVFL